MKRQFEQLRNWGAVIFIGLLSPLLAHAASSTGVSPIFAVDNRSLQTGSIAGRVLGAGAPLANAQVRVLDTPYYTTKSGADGTFNIIGIPSGVGYVLAVSASGYAIKSFPNIKIAAGPNNIGNLALGNLINLPVQLRAMVPDVNPKVTEVEQGGTAYRYYHISAADGLTLVGGVKVGLRRAGGAVVPQDGDVSLEWAGSETGKPDNDGLVRLRLPSSAIGNAGSTATFEVLLGTTVVQAFSATVKDREYDQVWKHKWSLGGLPYGKVKFGQSHETTIVRKFGGPDNGIEIVGRERDEEFKIGVKLPYGSRLNRSGMDASVGASASLKIRMGQSFRFTPNTTDVLDNLLKLDAAFADNINLVPVGGIVLEGIRQELVGFVSKGRIESTVTAVKVSGHVKAEAGFDLAWPLSDELAIYANAELTADVAAELGVRDHPGRYFDRYVEFSGNVKWEYDAKNTLGTPAFFQPGGAVKGTMRQDANGHSPRQLILESKFSVTTDSRQAISGWNENEILDLQPLEKAEYRNRYTLRLPGLSDAIPAAQSAWESINNMGQRSVLSVSQPIAWLSSVLGAGEPVAYEKTVYSAETTVASSPILEVLDIKLAGEKERGAVVKTEAGLLWKNRRVVLESYLDTSQAHYPKIDIFDLEKQWMSHVVAPIGGYLNRAVHVVAKTGETIIEAGRKGTVAVVRFGQGVMSSAAEVTTTWVHNLKDGAQLASHSALKSSLPKSIGSFLPTQGSDNYVYGVGGVYRFESTNAFIGAGTLTISYANSEVAGLNEADLRLYHLPDGTNRWQLVGGVVNALSNTVTATITNLGMFAIAPPLPTGELVLSVASNTMLADGLATSLITVSNLMLNNGQAATQPWLFTVAASGVEILDSDVTGNYSGVQRVSTNGVLRFTVRAPLGGHTAKVAVASVAGDATGELGINLIDNVAPAVPSKVQATAGQSRVWVSWQTNGEPDIAGYRVYYRAGMAGPPWDGTAAVEGVGSPISVTGTNSLLRGLALGTDYFVGVSAVDTTGNESALTRAIKVTTSQQPPNPPIGVAVRFGEDAKNVLMWTLSEDDGYNDRDVIRYDVWRVVKPGENWLKVGEVGAGIGLFTEANIVIGAGQHVRYAVAAVDKLGATSARFLANRFITGTASVDNDGDGMADDWELANGLNPTNPADANDDLDLDGLTNLQEFLGGKSPGVFDNLQILHAQRLSGGDFELSVFGEPGKSYALEASTNLVKWDAIRAFTCTSSPTVVVDTTAKIHGQRFYRVAPLSAAGPVRVGFKMATGTENNGIELQLDAPLGLNYRIEASTNLVDWSTLGIVPGTNSTLYFRDTSATNHELKFYRVLVH